MKRMARGPRPSKSPFSFTPDSALWMNRRKSADPRYPPAVATRAKRSRLAADAVLWGVAGTAGAVRHHQDQKYARQEAEAYDQEVAAQQAYAAPPAAAPAVPDYAAELEQLAQLKNQGIITEEEFEAKKKQILGI